MGERFSFRFRPLRCLIVANNARVSSGAYGDDIGAVGVLLLGYKKAEVNFAGRVSRKEGEYIETYRRSVDCRRFGDSEDAAMVRQLGDDYLTTIAL